LEPFEVGGERLNGFQVLWEDSERILCRGVSHADTNRTAVLAVVPVAEHPSPASLDRLAHEFRLREELDAGWAVRPLELQRGRGRTMLVLEDSGGEPLARLLGSPLEVGRFLLLAIGIATALGKVHQRGLIHKDIKPANILIDSADGHVRLTGFGIASRLSRERQAPKPPETIAGTLAYMAPEQTGRTNHSIDARSDLYALGVTLYQMLTGVLPFAAADPMEWVHCHIARKPAPPIDRLENVPAPVSAIIMKLLAKTPEERYQTAGGVARDLRRCLAEWEQRLRIDDFPLGLQDTPNRLLIPEKLYGREREIATLLACFNRIIKSGAPELVLVSGYSGIGKSSLVNEVHKVLVPPRGLFASGKFDQYKHGIPYATLLQAFQSLVHSLLSKSDAELVSWRHDLVEALGPNGRLMVDLIPELKLIIGDQPPAPELLAQQAQSRFHLVFQRFIGVFARPGHPLTLFLDDLQWLDAATLDLLEDLSTRSDLQHLLVIGAYRDNEVTAGHPLMRKLGAIKAADGRVAEITLAPLAREHVEQLIADTFRCESERAAPLAQLVHEKTGGNPFFANQFLSSLAEEGLLTFDHDAARWSWDLDGIRSKGYTENVVDLLIGKLTRLPAETQNALQQLACLGNIAEITTLSVVLGLAEELVDTALWPARRQELVERVEGHYRFIHDRVQEAAYSLIPEELRSEAHLRIGRLLAALTPPERREEAIFDIVNQLNRGAALIASRDEREQLAELNLLAGQRAKASSAYLSALNYLDAGATLLPENAWERRHELTFALELHRAECEFLTGALVEAEQRLAELARRALSLLDLAAITRLQEELFVTFGRSDRAVEVCLDYLRHVGIQWSAQPTKEDVRQEYERLWRQIGRRSIEDLVALPPMTDPEWRATMDVLTAVVSSALFTDENLLCLVICRMGNLSLEHGNGDGSCFAYVWLGMLLGPLFGEYRAAFRFGKLGLDLVEQRGLRRFEARVYLIFGHRVIPWTQPIRRGESLVRRAFDAANKLGDLTFAAYSCDNLITNRLATGDPLSDVQREAEAGLDFARRVRFGLVVDRMTAQLRLIRTLRGLTPVFASFNDTEFDEGRFEQHLEEDSRLSIAACWYWIRKLQARFFAGHYASAVAAAANAERLLWTSPSFFELAEYHLYAALTRAALCDAVPAAERATHLEALAAHYLQLQEWAGNCPENFENRAALVGAEIARIEGRALDAMNLYEQAIRSARANGFVHNEALAYEVASRFYMARGFDEIAYLYHRNARAGYQRWGADGKVRQLDELYPQLIHQDPPRSAMSTIETPVEQLDLATVIQLSQAVSSEIFLDRLIDRLVSTALSQAGAERGLLILLHEAEPRIEAEAATQGDAIAVQLGDRPATADLVPHSVLYHVLHTHENVILDDAAVDLPFADDPYFRRRQVRSVLCLPLISQVKLSGVLYFENSLTARAFAPRRAAVLGLIASQAAVALENARLYRDLEQREAKILRLVDANIIGIFFWRSGVVIEANDTFLRMLGFERADLSAGRIRWRDQTPSEWRGDQMRAEEELARTGRSQPFEKEYFRKDGTRVPVLVGSALFAGYEGTRTGVSFVLDLTERKRAEAVARDSERRYRELQAEMAHANRVATMGQLTGSIAHEINQPIGATIVGAQAALRWLGRQPPDLEEARRSLAQIVKDGMRAGEVVGRVRDLIKKAPLRRDLLEINGLIREVIELTHGESTRHCVSAKFELAEGLPLIRGDRVQLQQVILNLIINAVEAMSGVSDGARELLISTGKAESGDVLVFVRDSGPGLAPVAGERIFEAFYTTKTTGLGMGLSISRSIVEAHGGRLWATANEPRGAIFQFTLPPWEGTVPAEHDDQMH
jgi:PAS domain S-box-containing protein